MSSARHPPPPRPPWLDDANHHLTHGLLHRVRQRASAKAQHVGGFGALNDLQLQPRVVGMEPVMELSRPVTSW
jgi:hypothetical protein